MSKSPTDRPLNKQRRKRIRIAPDGATRCLYNKCWAVFIPAVRREAVSAGKKGWYCSQACADDDNLIETEPISESRCCVVCGEGFITALSFEGYPLYTECRACLAKGCTEDCAVHAPGCSRTCTHSGDHRNGCMITKVRADEAEARRLVKCAHPDCQIEFLPITSGIVYNGRLYCGYTCARNHAALLAAPPPQLDVPPPQRLNCENTLCSNHFEVGAAVAAYGAHLFCSHACAETWLKHYMSATREYRIPVTWQMGGTYIIRAYSLADAIQQAVFAGVDAEGNLLGTPVDGQYIEGSLEVEREGLDILSRDLSDNEFEEAIDLLNGNPK